MKNNLSKIFLGIALIALVSPVFGAGIGTITQLQTYLLKVSSGDTTPGYLFSKLVAGTGVTLTKNNAGANETITITSTGGGAGGTTTINGVIGNTFTFGTSTTGTDLNISTSTATVTFNLPTASAVNRGALSPTDWSTFNNRLSTTSAGTLFPSFTYASSTFPTFSYASTTFASTSWVTSTFAPLASPTFTGKVTIPNASTTAQTLSGYFYDSVARGGTAGQVLQSTGTSTLWVATTTLYNTASASLSGLLSSTDWSTFNSKLSTAVTSVGLSMPTGFTISNSPVTTTGTLTASVTAGYVGAFTTATGTSGTDFSISTTTSSLTINCPTASGTVRGCLSSTDWTTFNNKGSGTVTAVSVATANGFSGSSSGGATPALTIIAGALTPKSIQASTFLNASTTLGVTGATTLYSGLTGTTGSFSSTLGVTGKTTLGVASTTAVSATDIYTTTNTVSGNQTTGGTLGVTGKTTLANASSTSLTVSDLSYLASTTITGSLNINGNIVPRVVGYASAATITVDANTTDIATTTINQTTTFANPTGVIINGQMFELIGTATGTRTISWGTNFASSTDLNNILTVASGTTRWLFEYTTDRSKWELVGLLKTYN